MRPKPGVRGQPPDRGVKRGNWRVAPKLRQQPAYPAPLLLGWFSGEELGGRRPVNAAAWHPRPTWPSSP